MADIVIVALIAGGTSLLGQVIQGVILWLKVHADTKVSKAIEHTVNGRTDALLARIAELEGELRFLRACHPPKGE